MRDYASFLHRFDDTVDALLRHIPESEANLRRGLIEIRRESCGPRLIDAYELLTSCITDESPDGAPFWKRYAAAIWNEEQVYLLPGDVA